MKRSAPDFIAPLALEQFFTEYWEQKPLHIARSTTGVEPLLSFGKIEELLSNQPVFFPRVQLTQAGQTIDVATYADEQSKILPLRMLELYNGGATIVLSQAHTLFSSLNELCREVMRTMKMRCQTNVYVSPPGKQGFNAHYDTHDVFILQISGSKTFNFYPSAVELPFPDESFDANKLTPAEIDESIALSAGDTLYIPRGVVHDAVADDVDPSIHVTLGVYPVLLRDVLREAVQFLAESDARLRQSIDSFDDASTKLGGSSNGLQQAVETMLADVLLAVKNSDIISQLHGRFRDELALQALQDCHGISLRRHKASDDQQEPANYSIIRLRPDMVIDYECSPTNVKVRSFGQIVEFTAPISLEVMRLLSNGELLLSDLTEISDDQRSAMVNRLLLENLVEIE